VALGAIELVFGLRVERFATVPVMAGALGKLSLGLDYCHRVTLLVADLFFTVNDGIFRLSQSDCQAFFLDILKIGKKLREFRRLQRLSQRAFGVRIGASYAQISSWEREKVTVPGWAILSFQREFGLNEAWLRGQSETMVPDDIATLPSAIPYSERSSQFTIQDPFARFEGKRRALLKETLAAADEVNDATVDLLLRQVRFSRGKGAAGKKRAKS